MAAAAKKKKMIATNEMIAVMISFINTALPNMDEECSNCVWLPACAGGCPNRRLYYRKKCLAFKDEPEKYVLALYDRIGEERSADGNDKVKGQ